MYCRRRNNCHCNWKERRSVHIVYLNGCLDISYYVRTVDYSYHIYSELMKKIHLPLYSSLDDNNYFQVNLDAALQVLLLLEQRLRNQQSCCDDAVHGWLHVHDLWKHYEVQEREKE